MTGRRTRKSDPTRPSAETHVDDTPPSAVMRCVHVTDPARGPVHVDDGPPLTHPDTRNVSDSPLIRAYLDSGVLAETSRRSGGKETT